MVKIIEGDTYHIKYDSLQDFFTNTDPNKTYPEMHSNNRSEHSDCFSGSRDSWRFGDEGTRAKFYEARFDPEKGKSICHETVKKTIADKTYKDLLQMAMTYRKRIYYEDHGFRLSIPKAIAGEDRVFKTYKNARKPVVKIAINICGSASVDQDTFRKVANTAVPMIYALEQAGISTEVWYTAFAKGTHNPNDDGPSFKYTATHVKLKSAQQRFNWTTFAPVFTLGSYRESIFLSWVTSEHYATHGLGSPMGESDIQMRDNYGYTSVIGLNAPGPMSAIHTVFSNMKKSKS